MIITFETVRNTLNNYCVWHGVWAVEKGLCEEKWTEYRKILRKYEIEKYVHVT